MDCFIQSKPGSAGRVIQKKYKVVIMTNQNTASTSVAVGGRRRLLLGMAALAVAPLSRHALAGAPEVDVTATVKRFTDALLATMKTAAQTPFSRRFDTLASAVDQAFDLSIVLAVSVGPGWAGLSPAQQSRLVEVFRRYTVASYVANFANYDGQSFSVSPETRRLEGGQVVVQSHITPTSGDATELDYVMQQTALGWKVVDVLAAGSISRVAVQRSDFRRLLSHGGSEALSASLQHKTLDLSGGAVA